MKSSGNSSTLYLILIVNLFLSCRGYVVPNNAIVSRLRSIKTNFQVRPIVSLQARQTNSIDEVRKSVMVTVAVCSLALSTPSPSAALEKNPEALELRRVMQQPAGAPEAVKKTAVKLPSGVTYFDYVDGEGAEVQEGKTVQFQWVLRRSNGYFVDASSNYGDEPFIYKVGNTKKVIKGVDEGIRGMRVGGVRRMNIPPNMAFVSGVGDDKPGPMPAGFGPRRQIETRLDREVWYFEIKVLKVR
jgi:FKBP-type peptidyl-prolyl cis-trans isomerase